MKVCIVGASKKFTSGITYYTILLANAFSEKVDTSVICFRQLLPTKLFFGKKRVGQDIVNIDFNKNINIYDKMDYNNPFTWYQVYNFLKKEKPDIIILQWWTSAIAHMHIIIKIIAKLMNIRVIVEFHEVVDPFEESILPIRIYSKMMGKLLRRNLNSYITHSESDKKLVAERYNIPLEKIHVISFGVWDQYNAINEDEAKKTLSIKEENVILSFGLIRKYKGITYLIEAFEKLPNEIINKTRLLIVGEIWEDRNELLSQIENSSIKDKITLIDKYVNDDEVNLYFSASNIVVLPYLRASQSGVAHIAMAFKKPIIVSKVGGLIDSMSDYNGTYFVPPANSSELSSTLNDVINNYKNNHSKYNLSKKSWKDIIYNYSKIIE